MDNYNTTVAQRARRYSVEDTKAQVGRPAPNFTLEALDHRKVSIEGHRNREHVVLVFGSIT